MIRACDGHGYFDGEQCPVCGASGRGVLSSDRRTRLSKFVSGALRHFPDDAGLTLDSAGWTEYETLVDAVTEKYPWAESEHVAGVVATDPKGRFQRREGRIRAAYGHSVDVTLGAEDTEIPARLYHGTAPRNLDSIAEEGLKPMGRQEVHLSETVEEARRVGARHADRPVVLVVDADAMVRAGFEFAKRGVETYTVDAVPPEYLDRIEDRRR